jgi:hypothetical protein
MYTGSVDTLSVFLSFFLLKKSFLYCMYLPIAVCQLVGGPLYGRMGDLIGERSALLLAFSSTVLTYVLTGERSACQHRRGWREFSEVSCVRLERGR